jgi:integrase
MKGTIRPITRQRLCPKCRKPFSHIPKVGYICPGCRTVPSRFFIDIHWNGKRPQIYSGKDGQPLDSYQRALNLLSTIQYEIDNRNFDPSKYVKADLEKFWASELLTRFFEQKRKSIAPSYITAYRTHVNRHKEFFKLKDVREIRKIDIKNYIEYLETTQNIGPKTLKNTADNFKTFMYWLKNELEVLDRVPSFPIIDVKRYEYTWFSAEDQIRILEHIEEDDRPIIAFLMLHGCRPGEGRALKVKNINIERKSIMINSTFSGKEIRDRRKGRGARDLEIPIHPEMLEYFYGRANNHPEAFVFTNPKKGTYYSRYAIERIWQRVREKANLPKRVRLYDATRHSLGSQLANSGESVYKINKILGHSTLRMTEKYLHKDIESLRSMLSKISLKRTASIAGGFDSHAFPP